MTANPIRRIHIGAGDPLGYAPPVRDFFGDGSWVHLHSPGETAGDPAPLLRRLASRALGRVSPAARQRRAAAARVRADARRSWRYMPFWLDEKSALPFRDATFIFAFSEHVLEHLFLHEAFRLMKETRRILSPTGVFRVSVPDADLRPAGLEPLAFHAGRGATSRDPGRWNDPAVHKIRWNIYSLTLMLELAGFVVVPLMAYDRNGTRLGRFPAGRQEPYPQDADWASLLRADYLRRPESLIVDAIVRG
jgi:SAM-dependent methyltransferase